MTTARDIARWRLRSQHLGAPHAGSAAAVIRDLLAVQAENRSQAEWAVASRTDRRDAADLAALLDRGEVVRTHVLRPTWHFVAAADIEWLLELTAPRVRPIFLRQLTEQHGWTAQTLERAVAAVIESLATRPDQTREQLRQELGDRGVTATGQSLMLLLGLVEMDRLICSGRSLDGRHTYALLADRVATGHRLDRGQALAELAWRYFTGHGPHRAGPGVLGDVDADRRTPRDRAQPPPAGLLRARRAHVLARPWRRGTTQRLGAVGASPADPRRDLPRIPGQPDGHRR